MARFRDAVLAIALATGGVGCATFCDECDDFPVPGGPGGYCADARLLCWWAAECGARYGTSGTTHIGPGAVLAGPSNHRRSGWRGCSDATGPTTSRRP